MTITTDKIKTVLQLFPLPGPGINPFDMTLPALARLTVGEPVTVAAFEAEKERVWSLLVARVDQVRQFSIERAEFALDVWDAWVRSEGSFTQAAVFLQEKLGGTFSRQGVYHYITFMMQAGIIPRHRSRKPTRTHSGVKGINVSSAPKTGSASQPG